MTGRGQEPQDVRDAALEAGKGRGEDPLLQPREGAGPWSTLVSAQ